MNCRSIAARRILAAFAAVAFGCAGTGSAHSQSAATILAGDPCDEPALLPAETALASAVSAQQSSPEAPATAEMLTEPLLNQLIALRYPELAKKQIRMRTFHSDYDYFRTRFSFPRFFALRRMRYFVEVNPRLLGLAPPPDGVCAILGHELAHVASMSRGNRIRLFGLVRLLSVGSATRFERRADLEAIHRGFAPGLKSYRNWIYANIPPATIATKKRTYFTPAEIDAVVIRLRQEPAMYNFWERHIPMNLRQIAEPLHN